MPIAKAKDGAVCVPRSLLADPSLSLKEKGLLAVLHMGDTTIAQLRAEQIGFKAEGEDVLKELQKRGLIEEVPE